MVFVPSYNNADWCRRNLDSIFNQDYKKYRVVYIDDASTDGTYDLVRQYIATHNLWSRVTILHNKTNKGALYNTYRAIHMCDDDEVFVTLDGDDWFSFSGVLSYLNNVYQDKNIWFTYGQFMNWPTKRMGWCKPIPFNIVNENKFREFGFVGAQIRTWRSWLAKKIKLEDLISPIGDFKGRFYPSAGDVALTFPIFEMAGDRFKFVSKVLCLRNVATPLNDFKVCRDKQRDITKFLRRSKKYKKLEDKKIVRPNLRADLIIFSYDRPLQLYGLLESIKKNVKGLRNIYVLCRVSNEQFKEAYKKVKDTFRHVRFIHQPTVESFKPLLMSLLKRCNDYMLFAVDDIVVTHAIDISYCSQKLHETDAFGYFLRLGKNIKDSYMLEKPLKTPALQKIDCGVRAFRFSDGTCDWRYPFSLDMTVYNRDKILSLCGKIKFSSPNTLEKHVNDFVTKRYLKNLMGLCFTKSQIINIANNKVQEDYSFTRSEALYHKDLLFKKFNEGFVFDVDKFKGLESSSCHISVEFDFKEINKK
jgi:glycosyltransferase involved in cell wall biosynthesis